MGIKGLEAQLARIQSDGTLVGIEGLEAQFARARGNLSDGSDQTFGSDQEFGEHSQRLLRAAGFANDCYIYRVRSHTL